MELRPATPADLADVLDIDGTIESHRYLHVDHAGEGTDVQWKIAERPLRERVIQPCPMDEEQQFTLRQIIGGNDEGLATVAVHDGRAIALLLAQPHLSAGTMKLLDLRVDFDHRREGLATALLYQTIGTARTDGFRAVAAEVTANNAPANALLAKTGFELSGLDVRRRSNHDLVKETVTLFWYATLD